jgi:hypothetical protein
MKTESAVLSVKSFLETACPHIFARDSGYSPQFDDLRVRRRGAGYHGPLIAIEVLNQRILKIILITHRPDITARNRSYGTKSARPRVGGCK